jgi:amino acid transporter
LVARAGRDRVPPVSQANPLATENKPELLRAIGRWALVALVLNGIIGSGIFGLPDDVARLIGGAAPWAYLLAALGMGVVMAVFAEVASQFREAGGPYLWARAAFGQFAGVQMGWFAWLVRLTSGAANAGLFMESLGYFWPAAMQPYPRAAILALLIGSLTLVNVRGVSGGALASTLFVTAKLVTLGLFVVAGLALTREHVPIAPVAATLDDWSQAILALVFAYGGFEAAMMPMSEAKDPRRDAPFALFVALAAVTVFYTLIHLVTMWTVPNLAASKLPLADAAQTFFGPGGATFVAAGAMVSTFGWLAAQIVSAPRLTFAFAEQGDFPALFGAVHPRYRTPYVSIVAWGLLVLALAIYGSFVWNAILSAVGRLMTYGVVCAALPVLRRRVPQADALRLPAVWLFVMVGLAFCVVFASRMNAEHAKIVTAVAAVGLLNWLAVRRRPSLA